MNKSKKDTTGSKQNPSAQSATDMTQIILALTKINDRLNIIEAGLNKKMEEEQKKRAGQLDQIKIQNEELYTKIVGEINEHFAKTATEVIKVKGDIAHLQLHFENMDNKIGDLFYKHLQQDKRICLLEEEVRKANLVIRGIPEYSVDNIHKRVLDWLNSLELGKTMMAMDLIKVFRIGPKRNKKIKRNVLVKFANIKDKLQVLLKIREKGAMALQIEEDKIEVYQDISFEERKWRYSLKPITKLLRNKNIHYNWRFPQQLKIFYNNKMRIININIDPADYLYKLGLIETDEDVVNMRADLLKIGGYGMRNEKRLDRIQRAAGRVDPEPNPTPKPKRKRKPTREQLNVQKKSKEDGGDSVGEESEMDDQFGSGSASSGRSECGEKITGRRKNY